jgi:hypothetical protein
MRAEDKLRQQVDRYAGIATRRGLDEVERTEFQSFSMALQWIEEDKAEDEKIETEALAAEKSRPDDTRELFNSYRLKLKKEGRR